MFFLSYHTTLKDLANLLSNLGLKFQMFQTINYCMFWHPIFSQKNYNQCKNVMCCFGHPNIKACNGRHIIYKNYQAINLFGFLKQVQ